MSNFYSSTAEILRRSKEVVLQNKRGLHARPAIEFVRRVLRFESQVTIRAKGKRYRADRIIEVVLAELNCGDTFTLEAEGTDAPFALESLSLFLGTLPTRDDRSRGRKPRREAID